jgi:hypothetical protein
MCGSSAAPLSRPRVGLLRTADGQQEEDAVRFHRHDKSPFGFARVSGVWQGPAGKQLNPALNKPSFDGPDGCLQLVQLRQGFIWNARSLNDMPASF